jgi:AraC family transcriptional regulator
MAPQSAYRARINRVLDYIDEHLDEELRLQDLARVAAFSPFHFHRIFATMMGETVSQCIARLRLQRAASNLLQYPHVSITEIALDCGFAGSASFARAFKAAYGMSASDWRSGGYENSKMSKTDSKMGQAFGKLRKAFEMSSMYIDPVTNNQSWRILMKTQANLKADVRIEELPQETVAYVRHIGPYQDDE